MTKKLIDIYKQDEEANEFIKAHLSEFSEESYNDVTAIAPSIIKIKDISIVVQNVHLLKHKKSFRLMTDYFAGMSGEDLLKKYKYSSIIILGDRILKLKWLIKQRFEKLIDEKYSLERKKVDNYELSNKVKDITLNLTRNQVNVSLIRVKFVNRINYKFHDEDVNMLYKKADMLKIHLTEIEFKKVAKILNKYHNPNDLNLEAFETLKSIFSRYRWVNKEGYFLPKILDDAITQIINYQENREGEIHQLFQDFN